jgi:hypothetical protein
MAEPVRRRRRVRPAQENEPAPGPVPGGAPSAASHAAPSAAPTAVAGGGAVTAAVDDPPPWAALTEPDALPAERGLRGLVGGGSSQVTPAAAMRARDAARPTPEDLARAEAELTIVRRHWSPRE